MVTDTDFLAFELVHATSLFANVLQHRVTSYPIVSNQREIPFEHAAVLRVTAAIARCDHRNLVGRDLFGQRKRDAGGQRLKHGCTAMLAFQALIAFHATVGGIRSFTFFNQRFHAIDTAACIDQFHVIVVAIRPRRGVWRDRARAARQYREKLFLGLRKCRSANSSQQAGQHDVTNFHQSLLEYWHASAWD